MAEKYDELLSKGLSQLKELEFSHVPKEDDIDHVFSDKFIREKEKLLKKIGRSYWKYVNTVAKKIAIIIVTLIITFSSLMTVDSIRERVIDFVFTIYRTFTQIDSKKIEAPSSIETYYTIYTIPNGFDVYKNTLTELFLTTYWSNDLQQDIMLTQINAYGSHIFNSEHGEVHEAIINDTPCLICKDEIQYYCYWEFDGYRFELVYPADLGEEFMSEVVGKLVEIDPDELSD